MLSYFEHASKTRPRGETDITTGFGPVIGGSNPSEDAILKTSAVSSTGRAGAS